MAKTTSNQEFVGPRALFDRNFVPPQILYRKKEERTLYSLLNDSIIDQFNLNILYQGLEGIGKKVLINKVLRDIGHNKNLMKEIVKIQIDCTDKTIQEILIQLISDIYNHANSTPDSNDLVSYKLSDLWNLFKITCKKKTRNVIFVFNNVEHLEPEILNKILQHNKESKINLICTMNKVIRSSSTELLSKFDLKLRLSYFSYNELYKITKQRAILTFPFEIDKELIQIIADIILENHVPVPGKAIEVLRMLYPFLNECRSLQSHQVYEILMNNLESLQNSDGYDVLNYISEEDLLPIILLDNLSNHFLKNSTYYINNEELSMLYDVSCESIGYEKSYGDYEYLLRRFTNTGILNISKTVNTMKKHNFCDKTRFFINLSPLHLKNIVDSIFENNLT